MSEKPILFADPMVRAILSGQKTQTRRVVKPQPYIDENGNFCWNGWNYGQDFNGPHVQAIASPLPSSKTKRVLCPYGKPGDRLWVREAIRHVGDGVSLYSADGSVTVADAWPWKRNFLPPMHCPRGLSRILLEIVSVRVERLQDISEADAMAEGIENQGEHFDVFGENWFCREKQAKDVFTNLWCHINGDESWAANPWVWVVEFRRVKP